MIEYCITAGEGTLLALGSCMEWELTESSRFDAQWKQDADGNYATVHFSIWMSEDGEDCPTGA